MHSPVCRSANDLAVTIETSTRNAVAASNQVARNLAQSPQSRLDCTAVNVDAGVMAGYGGCEVNDILHNLESPEDMRTSFSKEISLAALIVAGSAFAAAADGLSVPQPIQSPVAATMAPGKAFPAVFGVDSAIAPPGGTGYVALTYVDPRGGIDGEDGDGDLSLGYTVGNPITGVSLSFGVTATGLDPFGESGSLNLSASRMLRAGGTSATFLGASADGLLAWGDADDDDATGSIYVSHLMGVPAGGGDIPMQFTLGYGQDTTFDDDGSGDLDDGVFAGLGIGLGQNLSASISATETQINLGATVTVPSVNGLALTAGVYDITDNTERQQVSLTAAFAF